MDNGMNERKTEKTTQNWFFFSFQEIQKISKHGEMEEEKVEDDDDDGGVLRENTVKCLEFAHHMAE